MSLKNRLLSALPFSRLELDLLISSAPYRYKTYSIPKREIGKFREISQPTPEIKLIQRWITKNELAKFPIHACATAYRENIGLLENVIPHKNHRFLLKLDFENFFPSITSKKFQLFMENGEFSNEDIFVMSNILFKRNSKENSLCLAIGAPSSPTVSNILMFNVDEEIHKICRSMGITYTRYADDLSFSTNTPNLLTQLTPQISDLAKRVNSLELKLNQNKTVHASKKNGRRITGLTITSKNSISIGRDRKKILRSQVHRFILEILSPDEIDQLKGYLSFLKSVEPEQIDRLRNSYGDDVILKILRS